VTTLFVAVGGTVGVLARYGVTRLTLHSDALIWSTENWFSRDVREALGVGLLGGFTTFSTFSVQAVLEVDGGRPGIALLYVTLSVVGGIAAGAGGFILGRSLA
jgi:CrcB protein